MPTSYLQGWAAISELMDEGASWSGHERNCCYLNTGDGTFADISAVSGLDFLDDGRALVAVDWDYDGDLDLWLKNRTSPQLRFMENRSPSSQSYIAMKLVGNTSNRDAIGAKVTVSYEGKSQFRCVTAGSGYLSQSSRWLHFGLDRAKRVDDVLIRWPDGQETRVSIPEINNRYVVRQSDGKAISSSAARVEFAPSKEKETPPPVTARIVLKVPLSLPPSIVHSAFSSTDQKRPMLINLWAKWCAACVGELSDFASEYGRIRAAGLEVLALNIDAPEKRAEALALFRRKIQPLIGSNGLREQAATPELIETLDAVIDHIRGRLNDWPMPLSLLVDGEGLIQIVYLGPVSVDQLLADHKDYILTKRKAHKRFSFSGRWYFRTKRNLEALAEELKARGRREDSIFYMERFLRGRKGTRRK